MTQALKRYIVTIPVAPVLGYILPERQELTPSVTMTRADWEDYLFTVSTEAPTARAAVEVADALLDDWVYCLGVRGIAMCRLQDGRREVLLQDAADYDPETEDLPHDAVALVETPDGLRWRDPDGKLRRSGALVDVRAGRVMLTRSSLEPEVGWFNERCRWPARLRRAMALAHAAEAASDDDVAFALWYFAFEILSGEKCDTAVKLRLPTRDARGGLVRDLTTVFTRHGFSQQESKRLTDAVNNARSRSELEAQAAYVQGLGLPVDRSDLTWWRKQRGMFVHTTALQEGSSVELRRGSLCDLCSRCMIRELDRLSGGDSEHYARLGR